MAALLIAYVAVVLLVDTLATLRVTIPFDWSWLDWKPRDVAALLQPVLPDGLAKWLSAPRNNQFDLFKLFFWFLLPVAFSIRWMDWGAWGVRRWKKWDWGLLAFAAVAGMAAMFLIPWLPGVKDYYRAAGDISASQKAELFVAYNAWSASWLPGWEFLHRYVLLAALAVWFPRGTRGWIIVPLLVAGSEAAYHLVKPWPEMLAMFGFGVAATAWAYQRSNFLLPLLAHWCIEIALVLFLISA